MTIPLGLVHRRLISNINITNIIIFVITPKIGSKMLGEIPCIEVQGRVLKGLQISLINTMTKKRDMNMTNATHKTLQVEGAISW